MDYLTTQGYMKLWYAVFWVSGWGFAVGVAMFLIDFFRLAKTNSESRAFVQRNKV